MKITPETVRLMIERRSLPIPYSSQLQWEVKMCLRGPSDQAQASVSHPPLNDLKIRRFLGLARKGDVFAYDVLQLLSLDVLVERMQASPALSEFARDVRMKMITKPKKSPRPDGRGAPSKLNENRAIASTASELVWRHGMTKTEAMKIIQEALPDISDSDGKQRTVGKKIKNGGGWQLHGYDKIPKGQRVAGIRLEGLPPPNKADQDVNVPGSMSDLSDDSEGD